MCMYIIQVRAKVHSSIPEPQIGQYHQVMMRKHDANNKLCDIHMPTEGCDCISDMRPEYHKCEYGSMFVM